MMKLYIISKQNFNSQKSESYPQTYDVLHKFPFTPNHLQSGSKWQ